MNTIQKYAIKSRLAFENMTPNIKYKTAIRKYVLDNLS